MNKIELFAQAITQVMLDKHYDAAIFELKQRPHGFWVDVQKHLHPGLAWPSAAKALSALYLRNKAEIVALVSAGVSPAPVLQAEQTLPKERAELSEQALSTLRTEHVSLFDIENMIEKAINKRFPPNQHIEHNEQTSFDLVPEPEVIKGEGRGRKLNRDYKKLSVTVNTTFLALFMDECKRLHIDQSRLIDSILWHHYGKPTIKVNE